MKFPRILRQVFTNQNGQLACKTLAFSLMTWTALNNKTCGHIHTAPRAREQFSLSHGSMVEFPRNSPSSQGLLALKGPHQVNE
jgi:hypothetical protein